DVVVHRRCRPRASRSSASLMALAGRIRPDRSTTNRSSKPFIALVLSLGCWFRGNRNLGTTIRGINVGLLDRRRERKFRFRYICGTWGTEITTVRSGVAIRFGFFAAPRADDGSGGDQTAQRLELQLAPGLTLIQEFGTIQGTTIQGSEKARLNHCEVGLV